MDCIVSTFHMHPLVSRLELHDELSFQIIILLVSYALGFHSFETQRECARTHFYLFSEELQAWFSSLLEMKFRISEKYESSFSSKSA